MKPSTTNTIDPKALAAAVKAKLVKQKSYEKYDFEAKYEEYTEKKGTATKATEALHEVREDLNGYLGFAGQPLLTDDDMSLTQAELITKLEETMSSFPSGADGKRIASAIGFGVTTDDVASLYWLDGQTTLKKAKAASGKVLTGLKTRYQLAAQGDLDEINKDKEAEKVKKEADQAQRIMEKAQRKAQQSANSKK